jgi:putative membrane protein
MGEVANYVTHLVSGCVLIIAFLFVYLKATPFDEIGLIQAGNGAAALSLSGAMIGFSLTIASGIIHSESLGIFVAWALGALVVQILAYVVTAHTLHRAKKQIEEDNLAYGGLLAAISLVVGIINAACLS